MFENHHKRGNAPALGQRLWWLILGRLAAAFLLILLSALWSWATSGPPLHGALRRTLPFVLVVVLLNGLYAICRRVSHRFIAQARFQLFVDVLLVTWLVWTTGDIHSPDTALYIVIISAASFFLEPREVMITSIGCAVAFTAITLVTIHGIGPLPAQDLTEGSVAQVAQTIGVFDISFMIVGLLAARLAQKQSRSDVELLVATKSLAKLQALHERIVESIRSGVITTDLTGRIYTFNAAAEEITRYKAPDVYGQEASIFFGDMSQQVSESMRAAAEGTTSPRFESDCLTSDGLRLRLGFSISPLFAESRETSGLVITFQDMTEVRALEETSRRQDRLAAVGRVAASIAHEIRNPLAAMRGSIQMLRSEVADDSAQANLMEIILRESDRLNRIITDYLAYARPRAASLVIVDVRAVLSETFSLLRNSAEIGDDHALEENLPANEVLARGDPEQLRQVCWNLSRNALQAMHGGGTLQASLRHAANGRVHLTFTDSGRGMTADQVEHLFEPFSSTTGGTGLGLSIVYQIIRDHGGTINVRSQVGQGTTITVELPAAERFEAKRLNFGNRKQSIQ
jgi:two-component system, NtrC family, sensor histidine kinase PilS